MCQPSNFASGNSFKWVRLVAFQGISRGHISGALMSAGNTNRSGTRCAQRFSG
jgi:hypothetical protein